MGAVDSGAGHKEVTMIMTHRHLYVRTVLNLYSQLPNAFSRHPRKERAIADRFFDRQIPIAIVESALLLGSARRLFRCASLRLTPIRSLAYFESIVEELLPHPFPPKSLRALAMGDVADDDIPF